MPSRSAVSIESASSAMARSRSQIGRVSAGTGEPVSGSGGEGWRRMDCSVRGPLRVLARTVRAREKAELWARIVEASDQYAKAQARTDRDIPVVILSPA